MSNVTSLGDGVGQFLYVDEASGSNQECFSRSFIFALLAQSVINIAVIRSRHAGIDPYVFELDYYCHEQVIRSDRPNYLFMK